uniref:ATP synthase complex subunit 8 n=1 Tax=Oligoryzomys stramineus TaxID=218826 RepID=A0A385GNT9_9RODE|nr:ATP synthase F0 subunit 8 [Oligoryzomys stramineus]AXX76333.1 ATP synthase F0 subunit 8 [Oligoryzomys stramineus]
MPQLDTSTWFTIMMSSSITLFTLMQLKVSSQNFHLDPMNKTMHVTAPKTPWDLKWTKIYSPHSLPLQ